MYKTLLNMWPKVSSWRLWIKIDVISYAIMIKHHFGAAKNSKYFYKRPARIETKNTVTKQGVRSYPSLWYFLIEVHDQWFQPETADQKSWVWTLCRPVNKDSTFPCFPPYLAEHSTGSVQETAGICTGPLQRKWWYEIGLIGRVQ